MSPILNHVAEMRDCSGHTVDKFGKDQTGKIKYQFNQQGWRSTQDYTFVPRHVFFGNSSVFGIGVDHSQIFASMFEQSYNCGLAANYNNQDIVNSVLNFASSAWYDPQANLAVVWSERNPEQMLDCYRRVGHLHLKHFFCGPVPVNEKNCWPMIPVVDQDVTGTHMGPRTHRLFYKILCTVFNQ